MEFVGLEKFFAPSTPTVGISMVLFIVSPSIAPLYMLPAEKDVLPIYLLDGGRPILFTTVTWVRVIPFFWRSDMFITYG